MSSGADAGGPGNPGPVTRLDALLTAITRGLLVFGLGAAGLALVLGGPEDPLPRTVALPEPAVPVSMTVPGLGIRADVVPIGLSADAVLDPPADPDLVGWWDDSAQPGGGSGKVVITGHTVHTGGGALDSLVDLDDGTVVVRTEKGPRRYQVTDRYVVSYEDVASGAQDIFGQDDDAPEGAPLILVTCTDWNGSFYESNVIVVARPILT